MGFTRGQILKFVELVGLILLQLSSFVSLLMILVIICAVLHYNSMEGIDNNHVYLQSSVYGGYVIIAIGVSLGFLLIDSSPGRRLDMYFTLLGGVLFLACGYFAWDQFHGRKLSTKTSDYGLAKAWLSIATGIIYLVDGIFGFRD